MNYNEKKFIGAPSCPTCKNSVGSFTITPDKKNELFAIVTRTFFGWCDNCGQGCEVEQYLYDGKWLVHKWRHYRYGKKYYVGRWHIVNELPVPLVVIGNEIHHEEHEEHEVKI